MQLIWLKNDLRLCDHSPLQDALRETEQFGSVLLIYIHEPSLIARPDFAAQHGAFIRETLDDLHEQAQAIGAAVLELVGEAVDVLERVWNHDPFLVVRAYQETGTEQTYERDKAVKAWCMRRSIQLLESPQNAVRRGRKCAHLPLDFQSHVIAATTSAFKPPAPGDGFYVPVTGSCEPQQIPVGRGVDKSARQKGGRSAALAVLDAFMTPAKLQAYPSSLSSPNTAPTACSRLSAHLMYGTISDREVLARLNSVMVEAEGALHPSQVHRVKFGIQFFAERLLWRSAYFQAFENKLSWESEDDIPAFKGLREASFNRDHLECWKAGRTGFPLVDACMRMLAETGYLNMRMRGMVSSFACNALWLPWRDVGLHLALEFLDYCPPIHWQQMQIHAGTSKHAKPMTYNVVKQARDQDSMGVFVAKWVPELRRVPIGYRFEPWLMTPIEQQSAGCILGDHYPSPIVDMDQANQAHRQRIYAIRDGKPLGFGEDHDAKAHIETKTVRRPEQAELF